MEKNAFIRVAISKKSGKRFVALVVKYGNGLEKLFFDMPSTFARLLDLKFSELDDLAVGDYEIV